MTKLKTLLEGFAWERKPGKPLPTLAEVQAEYEKNKAVSHSNESLDDVSEESNPVKAKIAKLEKELANVNHQYYKDSNLSAEKSKQLRKKMGDLGRELKRAKREDKTGSAGYQKTSKTGTTEPRWWDSDGDGNPYEPGDDVKAESAKPDYIDADGDGNETESMKKAFQDKEEMNESFISRIKKNLIGGATRK